MLKTITLFSFVLLCQIINAQNIAFPLKASADKKYLVDQNNTPVFLNGCSAWHMTYAVSYDEAKAFLLDRKTKKFNAVLLHILPYVKQFRDNNDKQPYGIPAFFDDDLDKPNELFLAISIVY